MALAASDLERLARAKALLDKPSLAARMTDLLGRPIELSVGLLPRPALDRLHRVVRGSLERALVVALRTLPDEGRPRPSSDRLHRLATAASGAVGGMFGLAGLAVELPVTTVIMLRSIGEVARSEGHDLRDAATRMACLEVFALGGTSRADDAAETGYYALRAALGSLVADAARHVAQRGAASRGTPALARLLEAVAARFGIVVEEKIALELVPVIGAAGGALVNTVFMAHFQAAARGHFIVRDLERRHGEAAVRQAWQDLAGRARTGPGPSRNLD